MPPGKTKRKKVKFDLNHGTRAQGGSGAAKVDRSDPTERRKVREGLDAFLAQVNDAEQIRAVQKTGKVEFYSKDRTTGSLFMTKAKRRDKFNRTRREMRTLLREAYGVHWTPLPHLDARDDDQPLTAGQVREILRPLRRFEALETELRRALNGQVGSPADEVFIHGTSAVGDILASRQLWGGHAGLKNVDKEGFEDVDDRGQEPDQKKPTFAQLDDVQDHHFFVAQTGKGGTLRNAGNAFIKGRQDADRRLREDTPLESWRTAGRPLVGILEFPKRLEERTVEKPKQRTVANPKPGEEAADVLEEAGTGIYKIETKRQEGASSDAPYRRDYAAEKDSWLTPSAVRLVSTGDLVRLVEHLSPDEAFKLPPEIRVLTDATWDGTDTFELIGQGNSDFRRLVTEEDGSKWVTYSRDEVIRAMTGARASVDGAA